MEGEGMQMPEIDFFEMILRATASIIVLLILTRLLGRKQLSQYIDKRGDDVKE